VVVPFELVKIKYVDFPRCWLDSCFTVFFMTPGHVEKTLVDR
jgi:hypothetical protein